MYHVHVLIFRVMSFSFSCFCYKGDLGGHHFMFSNWVLICYEFYLLIM